MQLERIRFPLIAIAILAALAAMWAGLIRIGWTFPPIVSSLPQNHGPLMVSGFLGVLISIERVVALGQRWMFAAPIFSALGVIALIVGLPAPIAPALIVGSSAALVGIYVVIVRKHAALYTITMLIGALLWLIGNALWLVDTPIFQVVLWWAGFLVLTIVGERLELGRLLQLPTWTRWLFISAIGLILIGLGATLIEANVGNRIFGVGMLVLAAWLLRFDIARRTVRQNGLPRFIAACMLSGYVWLGISGIFMLAFGQVTGGFAYDAILHALFLGFVFSMIFGHAPIILPSILQMPIQFQPAFYAHLILLHASLILRIGGDLATAFSIRQWGGMLNVIALLVFMFNTARVLRVSIANKNKRG
ncbi:MAG: hypothetical protein HZB51_03330 [Chloroflexi bacterium]|nr:hypothetical protein [Chloroflexota bacterium]